jgi:hypothetical protein
MRSRVPAIGGLLVIGVLASLLAASADSASARESARTTASLAQRSLVGTTVHSELFGMHVLGVQNPSWWPTIPFGSLRLWDNNTAWLNIETRRGTFHWAALDAAVARSRSQRVNDIVMVLAGTPAWASSTPNAAALPKRGASGVPKDFAYWDEWVTAVVTRYKGRITAYQTWNEANLSTFWTGTPAQLAVLTKRAHDIIKAIDPAATIVAPSTGSRLAKPFVRFYPAFLRELRARNWPVDVFTVHAYPASVGSPQDRAVLIRRWKSMLAAAGAPQRPLWDTEENYGLAGPGPSNPDRDIEGTQAADWTARTYLDALRLGISRVYWYAWAPKGDLLGIQMNRGTPAARALRTLQNWIVSATFSGCTGTAVVTCTFTSPDGGDMRIMWSEGAPVAVPTPKGYAQKCTLLGPCAPSNGTGTMRLAGPVLLRN